MGKCTVKTCDSYSEKSNRSNGVTFHKVPTDEKRREEWTKIIRLLRKETDWLPTNATVICSKHFKEQDKILPKHDKGRMHLSDNAVPMVADQPELPINVEEDLNVETDEEMIEILESPREHKMRKTIERLRLVSSRRLKCIKALRQKIRRLKIRNKKLSGRVKELKAKCDLSEVEEIQLNINDETVVNVSLNEIISKINSKRKKHTKNSDCIEKIRVDT